MRSLATLALAFVLPLGGFANPNRQETPPAQSEARDTPQIGVELVQVDVVVTDRDGNRVEGLGPDDFEIYEDGKLQKISNFSFVKGAPALARPKAKRDADDPAPPPRKLATSDIRRVFAFVVDDLFISFERIPWTKLALRKFVEEEMRDGDLVAIVLTGKNNGTLNQFTTDKRLLLTAIDEIHFNNKGAGGPNAYTPDGQLYEHVIDAKSQPDLRREGRSDAASARRTLGIVDRANAERHAALANVSAGTIDYVARSLKDLPGRKSLVWFTNGFSVFEQFGTSTPLQTSRVLSELKKVADHASRAGVVIYPIDTSGLVNPNYGGADEDLRTPASRNAVGYSETGTDPRTVEYILANATGGLVYSGNEPFVGVRRAVADQESYYFIGYTPDAATFDTSEGSPKFHDIEVKVKRPGLWVRSRSGFLGYTDALRAGASTPQFRLVEAMMSPLGRLDVELGLAAQYLREPDGKLSVRATMRVDASDLTFKDGADGRMVGSFDVVAFTTSEIGSIEGIVYETKALDVTRAEADRLRARGLVFVMDLPIKNHGPYQVRAAVRDVASEKIGAANEFVLVPNLAKSELAASGVVLGGGVGAENTFAPGGEISYAYAIYNPRVPSRVGRPNLRTRISIWKDGRRVLQGAEEAMQIMPQKDWKRVNAVGSFKLSPRTTPGRYTLEVDVLDKNASKKQERVTQWVDFEVVATS